MGYEQRGHGNRVVDTGRARGSGVRHDSGCIRGEVFRLPLAARHCRGGNVMRLELTDKQRQWFFSTCYPARVLALFDRDKMNEPDHIVGFNSRGHCFNLFASRDSTGWHKGTWLGV